MSQKTPPPTPEELRKENAATKTEAEKNDEKSLRKAEKLDSDVSKLKAKPLQGNRGKGAFNRDLVGGTPWNTIQGASTSKQDGLLDSDQDDDNAVKVADVSSSSESSKDTQAGLPIENEVEKGLAQQPQLSEDPAPAGTTGSAHFSTYTANTPPNHSLLDTLTSLPHTVGTNHQTLTISNQIHAIREFLATPEISSPDAPSATKASHPTIEVAKQTDRNVTEDVGIDTVKGQLVAQGSNSDMVVWSVDEAQGQYGTLTLNANSGKWQYQLDNRAAVTNALANSEQHTEQFVISANNNRGDQVNTVIDVVVHGSNDLPQISGVSNASLNEQGSISTVSGLLVATDPDKGDIIQWAVDQSAGLYGQLTIDTNGQWQYQIDNNSPTTQALKAGDVASETFTVTATDSSGQPVSQLVTIDVYGTNQAATINGISSASLVADQNLNGGNLYTDGKLSVSDPDSGQSFFVAETLQGQFGTLSIDSNGYWTYTADDSQTAIQSLNLGHSLSEQLEVQTADGTLQPITITITSSNNAPIVSAVIPRQTSVQDTAFNFDVPAGTFTDLDAFDSLTLSASGLPSWLSFDANTGNFSGTPANSDIGSQMITVTATDNQGTTVSSSFNLVVDNVNDAPVLDPIGSVTALEDGHLITGTITSSDIDVGDSVTYAISAPVAGLSFNPDGSWTFDPSDTAYQSLADGQVQTLTVPVTVTDNAGATDTQNLVINVTGTNDTPTVSATLTDQRVDQGNAFSFGIPTGTFADIDATDVLTVSASGLPSWLSFDASTGTFSGTPANSDIGSQAITVTATDNQGTTVSSNFNLVVDNVNDPPVLDPISSVTAFEDGHLITGTITSSDIDVGDSATYAISAPIAGLSFNPDGSWTFDPSDAAFQSLADGQVQQLIVPVTVTDSAGGTDTQDLVINVTGTNDTPTVSATITDQRVDQGTAFSFGIPTGTFADIDTTDVLTVSASGLPSWLSFDANTGIFSGTPANSDVGSQVITVTAIDIQGTTVSSSFNLVVNNVNDAPVLDPIGSVTAVEDGHLIAGTITSSDIDVGDSATYSISAPIAGLSFNPDGSWSFDPSDAAYQSLADGQVQQLIVPVTVTDSAGGTDTQDLVINVTGTNDTPTVSATLADQRVDQGNAFSFGIPADTFADIDASDVLSVSASGLPSWLSFDANTGTFSGTPANSDVGSQVITVTATDNQGTTVSSSFNLVVDNVNDPPVLDPISSVTTLEDGHLITGTITSSDIDVGDSATYAISAPIAGLSFHSDGSWTFDPSDSAYQSLADGQVQTLTVPVTVTDNAGATDTQNLVINVTGTNDTPTVSATLTDQRVDQGNAFSFGIPIGTFADIDASDVLSVSASGLPSWLSFDANTGTFSGTPANSDVGSQMITVTATDNQGTTVSSSFNLIVDNVNDPPVLDPISSVTALEDGHLITGTITSNDIDVGDSATYAISAPIAGLSFNPDGSWAFDPSDAAYQSLADGQVQQLIVPVTVTDSAGGTDTQNLVINVTGTNDTPTVSATLADQRVDQGNAFSFGIPAGTFADIDAGDVLTLSASGLPSWLSFDASTGTFSGTPSHIDVGTNQITVMVTDTKGDTNSTTFDLIVNNTNSVPVLAPISTVTVQEDDNVVHGTITYQDPDTWDTATFSTATTVAGFVLNSDGSWTFDPSDGAYQSLTAGQHQSLSIPVTVTDSVGATDTQILVIEITGTNDIPTFVGASQSLVREALGLTTTGKLTITDIDAGESFFQSGTLAGNFGELIIDQHGAWTYTLDDTNPAVRALYGNQNAQHDDFLLTSVDGTIHTIRVAIVGKYDAPIIANAITTQLTPEDAPFSFTVPSNTFYDVDAGDTFVLSTGVLPRWLSFDASTGTFSGNPRNNDVGTYQLTVTAEDTGGYKTTTTFDLIVNNVNDAPMLNPISTVTVREDDQVFQGTITSKDPDIGDTASYSSTSNIDGFVLNGDGTWSFDPSHSAYQSMAAGQSQTITIPVTVTDSTGYTDTKDLVIQVKGTNDTPTLGAITAQTVAEDAAPISGQVSGSDVDKGDTITYSIAAPVAGLTLYNDGSWIFDASDAAYQHLSAGQTQVLNIDVTGTDSQGMADIQTLTLTITGTNDTPTLAAITAQSVLEDAPIISGQVIGSDADSGDTITYAIASPVAGLTFNNDGSWTFDASDAAYQHLSAGQTQVLNIDVTGTDSQGVSGNIQTLTLTVTGTNDGATIAGSVTGHIKEDNLAGHTKTLITSGQLTVTDVDSGEATFQPLNSIGDQGLGTFDLKADGTWNYLADNTNPLIQQLAENAQLSDTITVQTVDGTTQTLTVTITGTNDAPTVSTALLDQTTAQGSSFSFGVPANTFTDIDIGDTFSLSATGLPRWLSFDSNTGTFSGNPRNNDVGTYQLTVTATDKAGDAASTTFDLTVNNINDAPVLNPISAVTVREDGRVFQGTITSKDPDIGDTASYSTPATIDGFVLNNDGTWSFDPSHSAYQSLAVGQTQTLTIPVTVTDAAGGTDTKALVIHVSGTNDIPVLNAMGTLWVQEDDQIFRGAITSTDPDSGDTALYSTTANIDGFILNNDGSWSFDPSHSAYQSLAAGHTQTVTIPVTVTDTAGSSPATKYMVIQVTGANDTPTLAAITTQSVQEDATLISGQIIGSDADIGDTISYSIAAPVAGLTFNNDGSWTFDASDAAYQHLAAGQTQTVTIPVTATDASGSSSAAEDLIIHVTGTNDIPVLNAIRTQSVKEGAPIISGQITGSDADSGDTISYSIAAPVAGLTLHSDGSWTFDASDPAYQHLSAGQTQAINIHVIGTDSHGASSTQTMTIKLAGTSDNSIITGVDTGLVTEDSHMKYGMVSTDGHLNIQTLDGSVGGFIDDFYQGRYGNFDIHSDGYWSYVLNNYDRDVQALNTGDTVVETITIQAKDGTAHDIKITIHGTDEPNTGPHPAPAPAAPPPSPTTRSAAESVESSPIDHYLQMVGLTAQDVSSPDATQAALDLPEVHTMMSDDVDADMLDAQVIDHFENPLQDDDHTDKQQASPFDNPLQDESSLRRKDKLDDMNDSLENTDQNDDDLLHNALNDMHSSM